MYRVSVMSSGVYAKEISLANDEHIEDIETLVENGEAVILVDSLDELEEFNVDVDSIEIV